MNKPRNHGQPWTPAMDAQLRTLAPTHTAAQIAKIMHRTQPSVWDRAGVIGAQLTAARNKQPQYPPEIKAEIKRLSEAGLTPAEIGLKLNRPRGAISHQLWHMRKTQAAAQRTVSRDPFIRLMKGEVA